MASAYDKASLVMLPHATKEGKVYSVKPEDRSGDFTFSRGSDISATRVNSSGLIEKAKENTTTYSQSATQWSQIGASRDSATSADPFGGTSAGQYTANGSGAGYVYRTISPTWSANDVVTASVYIRDIDSTYVQLTLGTLAFGASQYQNFDLSSGTKGTGTGLIDSTITSISGGWYRLSITAKATGAGDSGLVVVFVPSASASRLQTPNAGQTLQIFGLQTNHGLIAQDYVETTTTSVVEGLTADLPRLDYSGGASCPSLLLEPSRTNLITQSEYLASYTLIDVAATSNASISPEGVNNAVKVVANTNNSQHLIFNNSISTTGAHSFSVFAKAAEYSFAQIYGGGTAGNRFSVVANLSDGSIDTYDGITTDQIDIQDYGNGWYRIVVSNFTTSSTFVAIAPIKESGLARDAGYDIDYIGDGTSGVYFYGWQVEQGSYATSYIPTYGTAASRGADLANKSSLPNTLSNNYSIFLETTRTTDDSRLNEQIIDFNSASSDRLRILTWNAGRIRFRLYYNDGTEYSIFNDWNQGETIKFCVTYNNGTIVIYANGSVIQTESQTLNNLNSMSINTQKHKKLALFNTTLTSSEAIALTTL